MNQSVPGRTERHKALLLIPITEVRETTIKERPHESRSFQHWVFRLRMTIMRTPSLFRLPIGDKTPKSDFVWRLDSASWGKDGGWNRGG